MEIRMRKRKEGKELKKEKKRKTGKHMPKHMSKLTVF